MCPINRKRREISPEFEPICYGPVRSDQVDLLAQKGYEFLTGSADLEVGPFADHPANRLVPQFLSLIRNLSGEATLGSLNSDVSVVVGISSAVGGSYGTQGVAARTDDDIGVPNSFAIQLSAGALVELFNRVKGLAHDGPLLRTLPRMGLPDIGQEEKASWSIMRGTLSAFLLLYFHEIAHVLRNHHAQLEEAKLAEFSASAAKPEYARYRRVLENDADFIAMGLLARFIHIVPPFLKSAKQLDGRARFLWCLLAAFALYSVFADYSSAGDAYSDDTRRYYYSPLVRYHVLPLAASSNLGLDISIAEQVARDFLAALDLVHGELPVLASYGRWKELFNADLENWRETERARVLWQSEGRFDALVR